MKKIQVLGAGCPRCQQLAQQVEEAALSMGLDYELERVSDPGEFARRGVAITPALVVDGEVVLVGKVLPTEDIASLIS
jgi:small redox-active disulfide protein 2